MQLQGKLIVKKETEDVGTSGFQKRECVIKTDEQYPQDIQIEFQGDKVNILNPFKIGENVKIDINIRGRSWNSPLRETKYFNTIIGWRITQID